MTARPEAAPEEEEGGGSWADMVHCFQQSMGINMKKKKKQEKNIFIFGRQEGSRNTKRGFWACFSEKGIDYMPFH